MEKSLLNRDMDNYLVYLRDNKGKKYIDDDYKVYIESLLQEFRSKLPESDKVLEYSFINYLNQTIEANGGHINEAVRGTAKYLINANIEVKKHMLGDDSIKELFSISDKVFALAKKALLTEDFPVDPRVMDFNGILGRADKLKVATKPHNRLLGRYIRDEIVLDLESISNPLTKVVSYRVGDVYSAHRDERYRAFRRKYYKRIEELRKTRRWNRDSKERRIQKQFELYAEMKEQELGIKTDRSKSIGLNFVEYIKGDGR